VGEEGNRPLVLAVARRPAARRELTRVLTPELAVRELDFDGLRRAAPLLDAAAAVLRLENEDSLPPRAELAGLPWASNLVLVVGALPEERIRQALEDLDPVQALGDPVPPALLRFAVQRAFASAHPGEGARANQRRAPVLLGVSGAIREVLEQVRQVAPSRIPVLILGETGTGKELVARAIHEQSPRRDAGFVPINCGALPDTLLESELFGHRKGAFTGAERDKHGLFEEADGGTLFLDEIGEMSPALQVKLLRVLESREVRAVGDTRTHQVDVRLVSATNRDLEAAVEEGRFRRDLFYRINTVEIQIPPLRRRRVDIPFLAQHFAEEFGVAHARRITLGEDFIATLARFDFPGNVRELRNAVERAIALADPEKPVTSRHLVSASGEALEIPLPRDGSLRDRVAQVEAELIREALERCDWNRTRAAESLGLSRQGLRYKLRRLGLEPGGPGPG
jgi:transcriptional regulator with PAS, ATPase and Fis domain